MRWVWGIATAATILVAAVVFPKLLMIVCLEHDGGAFAALVAARENVRLYREKHGRFPESLEDAGLPKLTIFSYGSDPKETIHWHKVDRSETRRGLGAAGFSVELSTWVERGRAPKTVSVAGDWNGFDAAKGALSPSNDGSHWSATVALATGPHSFRWIFDGREGPLETRTVDQALVWDGSIRPLRPHFPDLDGVWVYDPETGLVILACDGTDTKHRRPWRTH